MQASARRTWKTSSRRTIEHKDGWRANGIHGLIEMLNPALLKRTLRDYLPIWAAAAILIAGFVVLFNFAMQAIPRQQTEVWLEIPWIRRFFVALAGADALELTRPEGMLSFVFSHPLVWTLLVAFCLTISSGVLAGEVDRGTMDLLASLPISRSRIYISVSIATLLLTIALCWMVWLGAWIGTSMTGATEVRMRLLAIVCCNLCAAMVCLSGWSLFVSAMSERRGMAVAVAFGIIFYSFVINFLRTMWPALEPLAFTSYLTYYTPLVIIRDEAWPWSHLLILIAIGAACWTAGLLVLRRRDFPAR